MSFRKKFFVMFFLFNVIFLYFGIDHFKGYLATQNINQEHMRQKEAVINLYKRRDFIKGLLMINDYEEFQNKKEMLKSKNLNSSLEKMRILKNVKQLEDLEIKILTLHEKDLQYDKEFSEIYVNEKVTRHIIRDQVYKNGIYDETKYLGEVIYKSKESIFQYRDQKHFDDWTEAVENLRKSTENKELLKHIGEYYNIAQNISKIVLSKNNLQSEIHENLEAYTTLLDTADKNVRVMENEMTKSIENINQKMHYKVLATIFIVLALFFLLGVFVHTQLIKPLEMLKISTDELSKKNFNHELKVHKNDEIGQLASHFNSMVLALKELYSDLENKVIERTTDLERSNSMLVKEMLEKEELQEILKKQANTDELIGLLNRRAAYTFLSKEIKKQKEPGYSMTICYLDIDNFKKINDTKGHEEGDRYLKGFSNILKNNLRQEDYVFRMGGDEFVAAFPSKNRKDVETIFEKRVLPDLREKLDIEFSYGIFEFSEFTKASLNQIIKKADESMYRHKTEKKKDNLIASDLSFI